MKEQYPVLDDRPINQWKVTELKDELKRRGLAVKGLKNDLIKRLAEAIRDEGGDSEEESSDAAGTKIVHVESCDDNSSAPDTSGRPEISIPIEVDNGVSGLNTNIDPNLSCEGISQVEEPTNNTVDIDDSPSKIAQTDVQEEEAVGNMINVGDLPAAETSKEDVQEEKAVGERVDIDDGPAETDQGEVEKENGGRDSLRLVSEEQVVVAFTESRTHFDETSAVDGKSERENIGKLHKQSGVSPTAQAVTEVPGGATDLVNGVEETLTAESEARMENNVSKMENEHSDSLQMDVVLNKLAPNNQVHVPAETDKGKAEEEISGTDSFRPVTEESVLVTCIESTTLVDETVVIKTSPVDEDLERNIIELMQEHSEISPTNDVLVAEKKEIEVPVEAINNGSKKVNESSEPLQKDVLLNKLAPNNQVYEVSPNVGNQVKFESVSTNSLSVSEKNELKDDPLAANVHLKIDSVKEETDQLPSRGFPNDGNFHPTEGEKSYPNQDVSGKADVKISTVIDCSDNIISGDVGSSMISKVEQNVVDDRISESFKDNTIDLVHKATEQTDLSGPNQKEGNYSAGPALLSEKMETHAKEIALIDEMKPQGQDPSEGTHIQDEGPFEKINVDPSSTDDSMDEDTSEAKQLVSNTKSVEVANTDSTELPCKKYKTIDAVGCDASSLEKMEISSRRTDSTTSPGKRKFHDEVATNKETPKRQRNWNSSVPKTGESGSSSHLFSAKNKNLSPNTVLKHNITKADSALDAPKERTVPPSQKSPTNSLRIDHFLRPFTLKAVQQLLSQTGKVCTFWMDQIKTHCYVTYSSVEEAIETRNSVYNLQWPPNGGRLLVADFVDPEDVKSRIEAPPQPTAAPVGISPTAAKSRSPIAPPGPARENVLKQAVLPEAPIGQPPPPSNLPRMRERLPVAPPLRAETVEPPIVTLDVLFRKTRATPRIYYLPLTDEEVAMKLGKKRRG